MFLDNRELNVQGKSLTKVQKIPGAFILRNLLIHLYDLASNFVIASFLLSIPLVTL
jgi:hypothetical protein